MLWFLAILSAQQLYEQSVVSSASTIMVKRLVAVFEKSLAAWRGT